MATIEIVKMNDDLDPRVQNGVETVKFFDPFTGEQREIELGEQNRKHFENHMEKLRKYVEASRLVAVPVPAKPKAAAKASGDKGELALIREWAKANGYTVGDRGRIKADIVDAFHKANGKSFPDAQVVAVAEPVKTEPEDLGYSHDGEKIIPCPDGKDGCEVMHTALPEQDDVDLLLDVATGNTQEYTDEEIDALLAEIDQEFSTEDDNE